MGFRQFVIGLLFMPISLGLSAREIVVGIEPVPIRKFAILFTPIVLPDLITVKSAFEIRVHRNFNLVLPLEAKWMDYHRVIGYFAKLSGAPGNYPRDWYKPSAMVKPGWNIDISQIKVSTGIGVKYLPFSEAMSNAFFVKAMFMAGFERFHDYGGEGKKDGAVFTEVFSVGYNWVKKNRFVFGFEAGQEYTLHTNPSIGIPIFLDGFMPFLQFSLGFTI